MRGTICPGCGKFRQVRKDNTIRLHRYGKTQCVGSFAKTATVLERKGDNTFVRVAS